MAAVMGGIALGAPLFINNQRSTAIVLHSIGAPSGEQIARPGQPLVVMPLTSLRAVETLEPLPGTPTKAPAEHDPVPAGLKLVGIQVPDGWAFCGYLPEGVKLAGVKSNGVCLQDSDGDGRLDEVRNPGEPFGGIDLLMYQPSQPKALAKPIRFREIPADQAPAAEFIISWSAHRSKSGSGEAPSPEIWLEARVRDGRQSVSIRDEGSVLLRDGVPAPVHLEGGQLELLGLTSDGALRYRVTRAVPTQVNHVDMTINTRAF